MKQKYVCNRCHNTTKVDETPTLSTQVNCYCPNCRDYVLHTVRSA